MQSSKQWCLAVFFCLMVLAPAHAYERERDVIYGRKHGLAMTLDVFTPKEPNGKAVLWIVSGGWFSSTKHINSVFLLPFLNRGYTVFAVVHGSQPKFTVPEIISDVNRAVRFIRFHAKRFKIDPDHVGVFGASAGGHLSLMLGTAGKADPQAKDEIDRVSSRVQAVACFFPPTDFLNWGEKGNELIDRQVQPPFTAAVDYHEFDRKKALFVPITDKKKLREITRSISPIYHVSADDPPTLIIHGTKDDLVPLQQSEIFIAAMKDAKKNEEDKLIVHKDFGHGGSDLKSQLHVGEGLVRFAEWFDKHLSKDTKAP